MIGYLSLYLSIIVLVIVSPTLAANCTKTGPCSCDMDDGSGTIDLSALAGASAPAFTGAATKWPDHNWQYSYNPCTPFDMQSCLSVAACQVSTDGIGESYDIGYHDSVVFSTDGRDVTITYNAYDRQRHTTVKLVCSSRTVFTVDGEDPNAMVSYYFTLESPECCVKGPGPGPNTTTSPGPNPTTSPGPNPPGPEPVTSAPGPDPIITVSINVNINMYFVFFPAVCLFIVAGVLIYKYAESKRRKTSPPPSGVLEQCSWSDKGWIPVRVQ
ncbi:uncharacterized protein [Branchiostoma lanceolatum]|uniref:uncharacterized protein n=1 Tax=Branchiostoma lanceolatum TaxID=7740 RepID=UPI00345663D6